MRILAQSSGKLMAELLRIISNFIYFLAQGHGCHSLTLHTLSLSVCTAQHWLIVTLRHHVAHSLTCSACVCVCVCVCSVV